MQKHRFLHLRILVSRFIPWHRYLGTIKYPEGKITFFINLSKILILLFYPPHFQTTMIFPRWISPTHTGSPFKNNRFFPHTRTSIFSFSFWWLMSATKNENIQNHAKTLRNPYVFTLGTNLSKNGTSVSRNEMGHFFRDVFFHRNLRNFRNMT